MHKAFFPICMLDNNLQSLQPKTLSDSYLQVPTGLGRTTPAV